MKNKKTKGNLTNNQTEPILQRSLDMINKNLPIKNNNCGIGWKHLTIAPTGNVRSCLFLDENGEMGNIFEQDMAEIFNSDKARLYANFSKM